MFTNLSLEVPVLLVCLYMSLCLCVCLCRYSCWSRTWRTCLPISHWRFMRCWSGSITSTYLAPSVHTVWCLYLCVWS